MKKRLVNLMTAIVIATALIGCSSGSGAKSENVNIDEDSVTTEEVSDISTVKVGVFVYQFADNFMSLYMDELKSYLIELGFSEDNIAFYDGINDQKIQDEQILQAIESGVDAIIVNPVNTSSSAIITDMAVNGGVPLVYVNREPGAADEARWEDENLNVTYVGCDSRQSGTYQGEIITSNGIDKVDLNGDGAIQYYMIEGDPENIDSEYRTEYSVKALEDAGWKVECLYDEVGNYHRATAQQLVQKALTDYPGVEVIFCNNDAMALGALESIKAAGMSVGEDVFLVGVDALDEALQCVVSGDMTGTVFNDHITQSHSAADAVLNYVTGAGNEHYISCNYVKVTTENVDEILNVINN